MRPIDLVHHGRHRASGVIIDPHMVGVDTARRRVLDHWTNGASLRLLPDESWLFLFSHEREVSAENSPGTMVIAAGDGLTAAPGRTVGEGTLVRWVHGTEQLVAIDQLPTLDPSDWIALPHEIVRLDPLEAPLAHSTVAEFDPPPPTPDFRVAAKVKRLSRSASRFRSELNQQAARNSASRTLRTNRQAGSASAARRGGGGLAKLVLRTPMRHEVGRRHARYLNDLSKQFRTGNFDRALREAVPIGGLGAGAWTLRLPTRRDQLQISTNGPGQGRAIPFGHTVSQHLTELYQQAAKELESSGRIDEAAFVLAELLNNPSLCIALLERHKRYPLAATLAENRNLAPLLRARLWWLAGDHERAIRTARQHNIFSAVITQLDQTDPAAARDLRLAWVDQLERSGDLVGAVVAGWPDTTIRPLLVNLIDRGVAHGGTQAVALRVYQTALHPSQEHRNSLFSLIEDRTTSTATMRTLAISMADARPDDPIADREIASRMTRAMARIPQPQTDRQLSTAVRSLRQRSDPLLVADLPQPIARTHTPVTVHINAHLPGNTEIHDAVPLGDGTTLLALGELGCRLLTDDGRTKAQWSVPCHRLVPADHSGTALLLTARGTSHEVHVLELSTRRHHYYGNVAASLFATSFDGLSWPIVDHRGIAYLDMLEQVPTVSWRELEREWICHQLARSSSSLAAIITVRGGASVTPGVEVWRWDMPDRRLKTRHRITPIDQTTSLHLLTDATSLWERHDARLPAATISGSEANRLATDTTIAPTEEIATSGVHLARRAPDGRLIISEGLNGNPIIEAQEIDDGWGFRVHGNLAAIWDHTGRYFVVDLEIGYVQVTGRAAL